MKASRLEKITDFNLLVEEVQDLIKRVGLSENQLICQGREQDGEDWHLGTGSLLELEHKEEDTYKYIFPSLKGTVLEKYIKKYNGYRTRIMNVSPRNCYSIHRDPTPRIHIPIVTNKDAWMVWPHYNECHHMGLGHTYWADTTKFHSFMNAGAEDRIHIIMCVDAMHPKLIV